MSVKQWQILLKLTLYKQMQCKNKMQIHVSHFMKSDKNCVEMKVTIFCDVILYSAIDMIPL
jgi:hypothetical protein